MVSTSPLVAPSPAVGQQQQAQQLARLGDLAQYEDTWVTVYGFRSHADLPLVLQEVRELALWGQCPGSRRCAPAAGTRTPWLLTCTGRRCAVLLLQFSKCGDIRQFGSFGDAPSCNWVHIQYAVRGRSRPRPWQWPGRGEGASGVTEPRLTPGRNSNTEL